jgi:hypothetical protein
MTNEQNNLTNYYKNLGTKYANDYQHLEPNYNYSFVEPKWKTSNEKPQKCIQNTAEIMTGNEIQTEITTPQNCKIKASLYSSQNKTNWKFNRSDRQKGVSRKVLFGSLGNQFHHFYPKNLTENNNWETVNANTLLQDITEKNFSAMFVSRFLFPHNTKSFQLKIIKDPYSTINVWISNNSSNFHSNNITFATNDFYFDRGAMSLDKNINKKSFIRIYFEFNGNKFVNKNPFLSIIINNNEKEFENVALTVTENDMMNDNVYYFMQPVENNLVNCVIMTNPKQYTSIPDEKYKKEEISIATPNTLSSSRIDFIHLKRSQNYIQLLFEKSNSVIRNLDKNHEWRFVFEEKDNKLLLSFYKYLKEKKKWRFHDTLIEIPTPKNAVANENWKTEYAKNTDFVSEINSYSKENNNENQISYMFAKFTKSGKYKLHLNESGSLVISYNIKGCSTETNGILSYLADGIKYTNTFMYIDKGDNKAMVKPPTTNVWEKDNFIKYENNSLFIYNPDLINTDNIATIDDCIRWIKTLQNITLSGFTFFKKTNGQMGCSIIPVDKYRSPINPLYVKDIQQYEIQNFEYYYYQPQLFPTDIGFQGDTPFERNIMTINDLNNMRVVGELQNLGQASKKEIVNLSKELNIATSLTTPQQTSQQTSQKNLEGFTANDILQYNQYTQQQSENAMGNLDTIRQNTNNISTITQSNSNLLQQVIENSNKYDINYDPKNLFNGAKKSTLLDGMKEDHEYMQFYGNLQMYAEIMTIVALGITAIYFVGSKSQ